MGSDKGKENPTEEQKKAPSSGNIANEPKKDETTKPQIHENSHQKEENKSQPIRREIANPNPKDWDWHKVTAIWTIILGVGTILLAGIGIYGLRITYRQIQSSDTTNAIIFTKIDSIAKSFNTLAEATKNQVENTKKSITISDSSLLVNKGMLDFSKKSVEIENRPLVVIVGYYDYLPDIGSGKPGGGLSIAIKNFGHTPAYITYTMGIKLSSKEDFIRIMNTMYTPKKLEFIASNCREHIVLEADQSTTLTDDSAKLIYTKSDIQKISKREINTYIYGDIQYNDFFGNHYYSHFCGLLDYGTNSFSLIGKYNDAN